MPVYLVEQDQYFDRDQLYGVDGKDYIDNCERFVFFSRAVLEAIRLLDLPVDVLHANDWQTGLVPAYLKIEYHQRAALPADRLAADRPQHRLPGPVLALGHALDRPGLEVFQLAADGIPRQVEPAEDGHGLRRFASTRSARATPRRSRPAPLGCGLEGVLQYRREVLSGILNGMDDGGMEPGHRPHLAVQIRRRRPSPRGKAACKAALQKELGLPQRAGRAAGWHPSAG